ncbi:hypothetical protein Tco_0307409, partial [Tanacetum coccineum]
MTGSYPGKNKYNVRKTQMLCLLKSHHMLGFINGYFPNPAWNGKGKVEDIEAWIASDSLFNGWILGSLSEEAVTKVVNRLTSLHRNTYFTSKDVVLGLRWDLKWVYLVAEIRHAKGGIGCTRRRRHCGYTSTQREIWDLNIGHRIMGYLRGRVAMLLLHAACTAKPKHAQKREEKESACSGDQCAVIMEYMVKVDSKARILELKRRYLKINVLTTNTPYPSRKIR